MDNDQNDHAKTNRSGALKSLAQASQTATLGAVAKPARSHQSCEVVARLVALPETQEGRLQFQATALFDGPHTRAGQTDTYVVRPEQVKACLDNLNKGSGSSPDSVLVFGNAWRDDERGVMSVGWVHTAISAQKAQAAMNGHHTRSLQVVFAQMPILDFPNVHRKPGEPDRIRWPLGLDAIQPRVLLDGRWQPVTFDRDWLREKLAAAWEARQQKTVSINLRLPVLRPEQAVPVRDLDSAIEGVTRLLADQPYRSLLTRVADGETVATRWQPLMRGTDAAAWAAQLLSQAPGFDAEGRPVADPVTGEQIMVDQFGLIETIDNRLLLEAARDGRVQMEWLPRDSLLLATKNAPGLPNDVKAILDAPSAKALHAVSFAFGDDPDAVSRVALILQEQPDRKVFCVGNPIRLDVGPAYTLATVPSPNLTPPVPAPVCAAPEPPLESATVAEIPPLAEDDDFALDATLLEAALDPPAPPQAESAPAPAARPPMPPPRPTHEAGGSRPAAPGL